MATAPANDSSPVPGLQQATATQFAGLLDQSRDLICESLDRAVARMLDKAKAALTGLVDETRDIVERRLYEETRDVAVAQRKTMEKQFQSSYLGEFRRRSDRARKIGQTLAQSDDEPGQLELVGEDDFDETLRFNAMTAKLCAYCDEELVALDQRVGVLLGDASLQASDNPFSPQVICDAYKQACRQVTTNARVRRVLLKLFDDHVLDDIRSMYKAVNGLLIQNSILPKIRYGVARSRDQRPPAPGGAMAGGQVPSSDVNTLTTGAAFGIPGAPAAGGGAQDFFSILQNLVASSVAAAGPAGFAGGGGSGPGGLPMIAPVLQGATLLGSLTQIQRGDFSAVTGGNLAALAGPGTAGGGDTGAAAVSNLGVAGTANILHELKATSVGAGMGAMDVMTLDIVAMLFDQIFDDPKVPNGVKGLIGRMQIPMLKVAIADKSFFSTKTHPARQLLDTLGEIASCLPADFSPAHALFPRLEGILEELVSGYQDNVEIFTKVRERLEALLEEEDQRIEGETRAAAKRVEDMEKLAVAKRAAEGEVRARVELREPPRLVVDFLARQWLKLLLLVHVKEGKDSPVWKRAVDAMDHLIWSIEPRHTPEERRKVVAVIPGLVRQLAVGMKAAGTGAEERSQFFGELMKLHRAAITVPGESRPESAPDAVSGDPQSTVPGLSAAEIASASGPLDLDFSEPVTVKNPFGEGEVNVTSLDLDFTDVEGGAAPGKDAAIDMNPVEALAVGMWVEFRETNRPAPRRPGRLIFVTPRRTRYLFAFDRAHKDIIPCTPAELSRRFRLGNALIVQEPHDDSLFDRIMKGLVGKLRTASVQKA